MAHARHPEVRLASLGLGQVQTHKPHTVTFDLADPGAIVGAAAEILRCFGHVDVLINNAGISYRGAVVDTSLDVDKRVMETNYFGPVALTKGSVSAERGAPAPASCPPGASALELGSGAVLPAWAAASAGVTCALPSQRQPHRGGLACLALPCVCKPRRGGPLGPRFSPDRPWWWLGLCLPLPGPPARLLACWARGGQSAAWAVVISAPRPPSAPALHDPKAPGPHRRHQQHPGEDQHPLPVGV